MNAGIPSHKPVVESETERATIRCLGLALLALAVLPSLPARGDLAVTLRIEHSETLQYEPVLAQVEIVNESSRPFIVARDVAPLPTLSFEIVREGRRAVSRRKEGRLLQNVYILPGRRETVPVLVSRWYNLTEMGRYRIAATAEWNGVEYRSNQSMLNIVRGLELARTTMPMPGQPRRRLHCTLRYWPRGKEEHLFLTVQDSAGETSFGVIRLGTVLRVSKPRIERADGNRLRTVHQISPNVYMHGLFRVGTDGVETLERTLRTASGELYKPPARPEPGPASPQTPPARP